MKILLIFAIIGFIKIIFDFIFIVFDKFFLTDLENHLNNFGCYLKNKPLNYSFNETFNFLRNSQTKYYDVCGFDHMQQFGRVFSPYESILLNYQEGIQDVTLSEIKNVFVNIGNGRSSIKRRFLQASKNIVLFPLYPLHGLNISLKLTIEALGYDINKHLKIIVDVLGILITVFGYYKAFS